MIVEALLINFHEENHRHRGGEHKNQIIWELIELQIYRDSFNGSANIDILINEAKCKKVQLFPYLIFLCKFEIKHGEKTYITKE